jgi:hypothetical protein
MAPRRTDNPTAGRRNVNKILRYAATTAGMLMVAVGAIAIYHWTQQYLITNANFTLAAEAGDNEETPSIRIAGIDHARRERVLASLSGTSGAAST